MNIIRLPSCRPEPLAAYLKALGVLRLIAEQGYDPALKTSWEADVFTLHTSLSWEEIRRFFVDEYKPTPIVAPWNGGSGFGQNDNQKALDAIQTSAASRFAPYRRVIEDIKSWPEISGAPTTFDALIAAYDAHIERLKPGKNKTNAQALRLAIAPLPPEFMALRTEKDLPLNLIETGSKKGSKAAKDFWKALKKARNELLKIARDASKEGLFKLCRARLPEESLLWFDAACTLLPGGKPDFNPLLGTGGNEGRLDFSNNFMQRLVELFCRNSADERGLLLTGSLLAVPVKGLIESSIGQFDPGRAGGYNQGSEVETKDFKINPWDFVLMLEGSLVFAGAAVRRHPGGASGQRSSPFTVERSNVGFSSSTSAEKGRAELWLPTWSRPAGYDELMHLFREGRSQVRGRPARTGLDFSRAVGTLGVDRGISSFVRYTLLERRGQSYVALPAGRLPVQFRPALALIDELDQPLRQLDQFFRQLPNLPARLASLRRTIDQRLYDCCLDPSTMRFGLLVESIGDIECELARRDRSKKPILSAPLMGLSPRWISLCDDGSAELRIAAALASIRSCGGVGPIRSNLSGVSPATPWRWDVGTGQRFWHGSDLCERLAGMIRRRVLDAQKTSTREFPLTSGLSVAPDDVMAFLHGHTDDARIERLLWGFLWIKWSNEGLKDIRATWHTWEEGLPVSRTWALLHKLFSPTPADHQVIRREPRLIPLLNAGRVSEACSVAFRRLMTAKLNPLRAEPDLTIDSRRLLASLVVPCRQSPHLDRLIIAE
ncbi:MAG: type I-U CRISPR-associated protein Csx17 [Candidatus Ozemobacteraceae bacterium]